MAKRLIIIRHGEVESDYKNTLVGATDVSLSETGLEQSRRLVPYLLGLAPERCFCSPMKRCQQTAAPFLDSSGLELEIARDLREADFGEWETMPFAEIAKKFPDAVSKWNTFNMEFSFPGGENIGDFSNRVKAACKRLAGIEDDIAVVFTHGGVIRFMLCHLLGLDPRKYVIFNIQYAGVTVLDVYNGGAVLSAMLNIDDIG